MPFRYKKRHHRKKCTIKIHYFRRFDLTSLSFLCIITNWYLQFTAWRGCIYTVPMKATVSILYAIKTSSVTSTEDLRLVVTKGSTTSEIAPAGTMIISDETYIVFEYTGLTASEMRTTVSAYIRCGEARGNAVEYSVATFAEAYAAKGGQYVELVSAMLAYGDAVAKLAAGSK